MVLSGGWVGLYNLKSRKFETCGAIGGTEVEGMAGGITGESRVSHEMGQTQAARVHQPLLRDAVVLPSRPRGRHFSFDHANPHS